MKNTAIGLLTGSLCLLLGRASSSPVEPLHPRNIVNLSGFETMGPGENLIVYQVPNDAWLVVTDADRASEPVAVCGFGYIDAAGYHDLLNATDFHDGYHSSTGLGGNAVVGPDRVSGRIRTPRRMCPRARALFTRAHIRPNAALARPHPLRKRGDRPRRRLLEASMRGLGRLGARL